MIYFLTFFFSVVFLALGEKRYNRNKTVGKIIILVGLLFPIVLAGVRDTSVGVDVEYYVTKFFDRAHSRLFYGNPFNYARMNNIDILYALLNWYVGYFTKDVHVLLFIIEAIIILFVYMGFWNLKDGRNTWLLMSYFYLLCYNNSLSTIRQSIGIAFILYGISLIFLFDYSLKGYCLSIVFILIATGFQTGSFVGIIVVFFIFAIRRGYNLWKIEISFAFGLFMIYIFRNRMMGIMYMFAGSINSKYISQSVIVGGGLSDNITSTLMCLCIVIFSIFVFKREKKINSMYKVLVLTVISTSLFMLMFYFFLSTYQPVVRLMLSLQILWPLVLSKSSVIAKNNSANKISINSLTLAMVAAYWYYMYIIVDMVRTANYKIM